MAPLRPSIAIAAVALSLLAVTTTAASAQENLVGRRDDGATTTGLGGRSYTYTVRDKKLANSNYVNKGQRIGDCTIETKGGTCTISSGMSATRTVQLALGASRDNISAQLSPSSTTTQSVTAGCTSPAMAAGKVWTAWPTGNLWQYRINKRVHERRSDGMDYDGGTSDLLKAFDPSQTRISCGLR